MKRKSRILAAVMLAAAAAFVLYALQHPEGSFPWGNGVTYALYAAWLLVMLLLFIAPFRDK